MTSISAKFSGAIVTAALLSACASTPMRPPDILTSGSEFLIEFHDPSDVDNKCKAKAQSLSQDITATKTVEACTFKVDEKDTTRVIAPNPCDVKGESYAALLCHELGHVNEISLNLTPNHENWKAGVAETIDWTANLQSAPAYSAYIPNAPTRSDVWNEWRATRQQDKVERESD